MTTSLVNANSAAAKRASPSNFFVLNEFFYPKLPNIFKILDHAHPIFGSIPLVQMFKPVAGKHFALKTKLRFTFFKYLAGFDFASNAGNRLFNTVIPASRAFVFFS
jgi:hypothetical protein